VAELLEVYTNGFLPATRHRVIIPQEEKDRRKSRLSMVFFTTVNAEQEV